jgi:hypothetical protein
MNEKNDESLEALVLRVFQAVGEIRKGNSANAAAVRNLQETCEGIARLLENHTAALNSHQRTLEVLAREAGLAFGEEPPAAPGTLN